LRVPKTARTLRRIAVFIGAAASGILAGGFPFNLIF